MKLDRGVSRKSRNWAKQQKTGVNKLELRNQLGRTWENLLPEYFGNEISQPHLPNSWWRILSPGLSVSFCSRGAWLVLHWKIWFHVTNWNSGTKACTCTEWWCSMLLHAALESTSERRATNHNRSPWEGSHDEHYSFLVDRSGYDERIREFSKEAGPRSIQKASKLGQASESSVE